MVGAGSNAAQNIPTTGRLDLLLVAGFNDQPVSLQQAFAAKVVARFGGMLIYKVEK